VRAWVVPYKLRYHQCQIQKVAGNASYAFDCTHHISDWHMNLLPQSVPCCCESSHKAIGDSVRDQDSHIKRGRLSVVNVGGKQHNWSGKVRFRVRHHLFLSYCHYRYPHFLAPRFALCHCFRSLERNLDWNKKTE